MATGAANRKRPKLVWVISLFEICFAGVSLLSFALIYSGALPLDEAQRVYLGRVNLFDNALGLAMVSLSMIGAILLFLLRRHAYHCFLTAFALRILMAIYETSFKHWLDAIDGPGLIRDVIGWVIGIAIILYSQKLIHKDILK